MKFDVIIFHVGVNMDSEFDAKIIEDGYPLSVVGCQLSVVMVVIVVIVVIVVMVAGCRLQVAGWRT